MIKNYFLGLLVVSIFTSNVIAINDDTWKKIHTVSQVLTSLCAIANLTRPIFIITEDEKLENDIALRKINAIKVEKAFNKCLLANKSSDDLNRHGMPTVCDDIMSQFILACGLDAFKDKTNDFKFLRQSIDANHIGS